MNSQVLKSQTEFPLPWRGVGVRLLNAGKRFNREWIFRNFNYEFVAGKTYAITGANGSGKSTLLQVIAGSLTYNEGNVQYSISPSDQAVPTGNVQCSPDHQYKFISIAAPYLELIEEMTANEFLSFHSSFKPLSIKKEEALEIVHLQKAGNKEIRYFSSGMKQRLKLAQAFFTNTPLLLLDEPTTNLDTDGIVLYHQLINNYAKEKLVIVSSNDKQEYDFCEEVIEIGKYK